MSDSAVETAAPELDGTHLPNRAVDGLVYAVFTVPVAATIASQVGRFTGLIISVLVLLGPAVVFGLGDRGLLTAFVFVFPATHVLLLFANHSDVFARNYYAYGVAADTSWPYTTVLYLSVAITFVVATAGYALGWTVARLHDEFAATG